MNEAPPVHAPLFERAAPSTPSILPSVPSDATPLERADGGADDPLIGEVLAGSFLITQLLDEGGLGRVYEAEHVRLPRRFAVKVMLESLAENVEAMARFEREAQAIARVSSEHVLEVVDVVRTKDGRPRIVSELLEGEEPAMSPNGSAPASSRRRSRCAGGLSRARRGARSGRRSPGSQALEPLSGPPRRRRDAREDPRLRRGQSDRRRRPHAHRDGCRDAGVHGAGAGARLFRGRRAGRYLLGRRGPLSPAHRRGGVRRRRSHRRLDAPSHRGSQAASRPQSSDPRRRRAPRAAGDGAIACGSAGDALDLERQLAGFAVAGSITDTSSRRLAGPSLAIATMDTVALANPSSVRQAEDRTRSRGAPGLRR